MAIREPRAKPRNDAYTGLLAISFLALVGATVMMVLDIDRVGKKPANLTIDVPGKADVPKSVNPLHRPDAGKIEAPGAAPAPKVPPGMSKSEPGKLPTFPAAEVASDILPAKAEVPAGNDGPPLPVKPFVPPQ